MGKYDWEKVADRKGDHRVFRSKDGRLAIADRSGPTPERTEDGILWLMPKGSAEIYVSEYSKRLMVCYTVHGEGGGPRDLPEETSTCHSGLHVVPFLRELHYDFTFRPTLTEDLAILGEHVPLSAWSPRACDTCNGAEHTESCPKHPINVEAQGRYDALVKEVVEGKRSVSTPMDTIEQLAKRIQDHAAALAEYVLTIHSR